MPAGSSGAPSAPVVLHCDRGGRDAALAAAVREDGHDARLAWYAGDPVDGLASDLVERAEVRIEDGSDARDDADRGAWMDLFNARENQP